MCFLIVLFVALISFDDFMSSLFYRILILSMHSKSKIMIMKMKSVFGPIPPPPPPAYSNTRKF